MKSPWVAAWWAEGGVLVMLDLLVMLYLLMMQKFPVVPTFHL